MKVLTDLTSRDKPGDTGKKTGFWQPRVNCRK